MNAEIVKAISWSNKTNGNDHFAVHAYFTLHNGVSSPEPITSDGYADQVWYAVGEVGAVALPTPHLSGTLTNVSKSSPTGVLASSDKLAVNVEIYPEGKLNFQRLRRNGTGWLPIGGAPFTKLLATSVGDVLLTAVDGNEIVTVGVARMPESVIVS